MEYTISDDESGSRYYPRRIVDEKIGEPRVSF
jgi:hypothetical protein